MNIVENLKAQARPEMNPELSWAIIILLVGVIVWVTVRYINRLDAMLDRLDTAIDGIQKILTTHQAEIKKNEEDIKNLKEANKARRR